MRTPRNRRSIAAHGVTRPMSSSFTILWASAMLGTKKLSGLMLDLPGNS